VLHGQRIYHRGEHAHVVARGALHADRRARQTAENVAAADHQTQLDPEPMDRLDLLGDARDHRRVEPIIALAHQRFARDFEKHATILQIGRHASRAYPAERPRHRGRPEDYTKVGPPQWNLTGLISARLGGSALQLGPDLAGEIRWLPLNPFAKCEADKSGNPDRLPGRLRSSFDDLAD